MRRVILALFAGCLLAACEEAPTMTGPTEADKITGGTGVLKNSSTVITNPVTTNNPAEGTARVTGSANGKGTTISIQLPKGTYDSGSKPK